MVLIFFRLVFQSLAMPCRLSSSLHFPPPVGILFRPLNLAAFHLLLLYLPLLFPILVLCWPHCLSISPSALLQQVSMPSAYAPIFIPLRCLSLSFCILNCPYPASFPFLALQSIPPGLLLYLIFHFLPASQSRRVSPALAPPLLFPFLFLFRPHYLSISPGLATPSPSPQGYTSVLQMFCPSQI